MTTIENRYNKNAKWWSAILLVLIFMTNSKLIAQNIDSHTVSFDADWSFKKDNLASGPEKANFDASGWRKINLPHDWSIEDLPNQIPDSIVGPFSKASVGGHNTGYTVGGTAWYRKVFTLKPSENGKIVYIRFDGVYMNSDVWINGHHLRNHPNGYTPFYYDLTPYLQPTGKENTIAVQVKNEGVNSRWYSGSGIYRHVWLTTVNPLHVDVWGVYVTTPKVTNTTADIQVITTIKNAGKTNSIVTLQTQLIDASSKVTATANNNISVAAGGKTDLKQTITLDNPKLWSPETPHLYKAKTTVLLNGKKVDNQTTVFGVRDLTIDAQHGLQINGKRVILKGGDVHHDYGPLGSAAIDRAEERKIEVLKSNGYNAIRCSHNPPSQTFLDICDRLGMLVIDEAFDMWQRSKTTDDYHQYFEEWWNKDLTNMILRDRNHPSIILWSIGNEVPNRADSSGLAMRRILAKRVHELEPTRKVTEAICRTPQWETKTPPMFQELDVAGYNYQLEKYDSDHKKYPERIIVGTESYPFFALENWEQAVNNPHVLGNFVWTAIDYIGEVGCGYYGAVASKGERATIGWPVYTANCGDIDLIGNKNAASYYRDVVWENSKIEMFSRIPLPENMFEFRTWWGWPDERKSWSWPGKEGQKMNVTVYARCQSVKLELNGKIIAEQKIPEKSITANFDVPYQPGILIAKGYSDGKEICSTVLKTTGTPAAIRLKADRSVINANKNDLAYVSVEIVDSEGNLVPYADDIKVNYSISGKGEIAGVGNGNPSDISSFQQPGKKVYQGKGSVIMRPKGATGKIFLKATADGLKEESIEITTK
jgi:Beta-galactosidase/beta-glucuronidase